MSSLRNYKIVNLRALAILTVVVGHSIILYSSEWSGMSTDVTCPFLDCVKNVINLYQMELYFFISGFLMYRTLQKGISYKDFIISKTTRLLLPYYAVGFLWMIPLKWTVQIPSYQSASALSIFKSFLLGTNNGHLWFLYALFIVMIISYPLNRLCIRRSFGGYIMMVISFILVGCGKYLPASLRLFNISDALYYFFWFQLGIIICLFKTTHFLLVSILSTLSISIFYPFALISLAIVLALYYIIPDKSDCITDFIDRRSYGIYLFQSPLIYITYKYIPNESPFLVVFVNFFIMGGLSILLTSFIQKQGVKKYLQI